jgi:mono/diheme cytochrome c family protein
MANRGLVLAAAIAGAVGLAACGRATDDQINQLLGITPTPTPSAEQIAEATAEASATAAARAAAAASPAGGAAVAMGDVVAGRRQFTTWCAGCHGPGGSGPAILEAGGPGAAVTAENLLPLVREGDGHPSPPGPYATTQVSDKQVRDLAAYIREQASSE